MLSKRQEGIWSAWVELLKSEGVQLPLGQGLGPLEEWCVEPSRDPEMRIRSPYKKVILDALEGRMTTSHEGYGLRPSKQFQKLRASSSEMLTDDSAMMAFLRDWPEGAFDDKELLYSKLPEGSRRALVSKFTNSAEEDERQLQTQMSIRSWIDDKSKLLSARRRAISDHSLDDEGATSFVDQEQSDIESLLLLEEHIKGIRQGIQSGFVNAFMEAVVGTTSGAPPNIAVDFLEGEATEEIRGIISRSESKSGVPGDPIALLSSAVEGLKAEFQRSVEKSDVVHDEIIEKQSMMLDLAMGGH